MKRKTLLTGLAVTVLTTASVAGGLAFAKGSMDRGMGRGMERPSFETLDADGDGTITIVEIRAFGTAKFNESDADGDGLLSAEELQAVAMTKAAERAEKMTARMIEWRDTDGDGLLSEAELGGGMDQRMFSRMDADDDGVISAEEYADAEKRGKGRDHKRGGGKDGHGERGAKNDG